MPVFHRDPHGTLLVAGDHMRRYLAIRMNTTPLAGFMGTLRSEKVSAWEWTILSWARTILVAIT